MDITRDFIRRAERKGLLDSIVEWMKRKPRTLEGLFRSYPGWAHIMAASMLSERGQEQFYVAFRKAQGRRLARQHKSDALYNAELAEAFKAASRRR